jgi:hypothetical protein
MGRAPVSYIGQKFGRLMAIEKVRKAPGPNGLFYTCRCECGTVLEVRYANLKTGNTRSCGCLRKEERHQRRHTDEYLRVSKVGCYYRRNANDRGIAWSLERNDVAELTVLPCHYCGYDDSFVGMDRVDNTRGYERSNVVPCCHTCNWAKRDMTAEQFQTWIKQVYEHTYKT